MVGLFLVAAGPSASYKHAGNTFLTNVVRLVLSGLRYLLMGSEHWEVPLSIIWLYMSLKCRLSWGSYFVVLRLALKRFCIWQFWEALLPIKGSWISPHTLSIVCLFPFKKSICPSVITVPQSPRAGRISVSLWTRLADLLSEINVLDWIFEET